MNRLMSVILPHLQNYPESCILGRMFTLIVKKKIKKKKLTSVFFLTSCLRLADFDIEPGPAFASIYRLRKTQGVTVCAKGARCAVSWWLGRGASKSRSVTSTSTGQGIHFISLWSRTNLIGWSRVFRRLEGPLPVQHW